MSRCVLRTGWLDSMLEQFEESRQHNLLHNVLRSEDRWDSVLSASRQAVLHDNVMSCYI